MLTKPLKHGNYETGNVMLEIPVNLVKTLQKKSFFIKKRCRANEVFQVKHYKPNSFG